MGPSFGLRIAGLHQSDPQTDAHWVAPLWLQLESEVLSRQPAEGASGRVCPGSSTASAVGPIRCTEAGEGNCCCQTTAGGSNLTSLGKSRKSNAAHRLKQAAEGEKTKPRSCEETVEKLERNWESPSSRGAENKRADRQEEPEQARREK